MRPVVMPVRPVGSGSAFFSRIAPKAVAGESMLVLAPDIADQQCKVR